jgi:hypothetical protein
MCRNNHIFEKLNRINIISNQNLLLGDNIINLNGEVENIDEGR